MRCFRDPELTPEVMQAELARAQVEHRSQGTRTDLLLVQNTNLTHGSTNSAYLLRRLARDHPATLSRYESGAFKSVLASITITPHRV